MDYSEPPSHNVHAMEFQSVVAVLGFNLELEYSIKIDFIKERNEMKMTHLQLQKWAIKTCFIKKSLLIYI